MKYSGENKREEDRERQDKRGERRTATVKGRRGAVDERRKEEDDVPTRPSTTTLLTQ